LFERLLELNSLDGRMVNHINEIIMIIKKSFPYVYFM
jgi:hypothetical protein